MLLLLMKQGHEKEDWTKFPKDSSREICSYHEFSIVQIWINANLPRVVFVINYCRVDIWEKNYTCAHHFN